MGESHTKVAEIGVMIYRPKNTENCQQPPESRKGKAGCFHSTLGESKALLAL